MSNIKKLMNHGFYFSFTYDLTNSISRHFKQKSPNQLFLWNKYFHKKLNECKISDSWKFPLIQGFIGYFADSFKTRKLQFYLISRRSCEKGGTRLNDRGINDNGNVSNFVETEQIMKYNEYLSSHVQVRGSVPAFWEQKNDIKLLRDDKFTEESFYKHFDCLKAMYGKVFCINLLSKASKSEQMLTNFYEKLFQNNPMDNVFYRFIDFHEKCKNQNFSGINESIWLIKKCIDEFSFFAFDLKQNQAMMNQDGVFRSNCLDCLDRTNVFMCKIAYLIFANQLTEDSIDMSYLNDFDNGESEEFGHLIRRFKEIWADNSDILSYHYCGSGSTTSSALRNGWGIKGLLDSSKKSVERYYNKNFLDKAKQDAIDAVLGNTRGKQNEKEKYTMTKGEGVEDVSIYTATWNLAGISLKDVDDHNFVIGYLLQKGHEKDIIVLGFQEIVKLKAKNVIGPFTNDKNKLFWLNEVQLRLPTYRLIGDASLIGLYLMIFVKNTMLKKISEIQINEAKTGFLNKLGNKGGISISFKINDTRLMFVNCHLTSGKKNDKARIQSLEEIHKRIIFSDKNEIDIENDYIFIIGDFNFRITLDNKNVRDMLSRYQAYGIELNQMCQHKILSDLLVYDQLEEAKKSNRIFSEYNEGAITFLPTYKFDIGTNIYDTSKKKRTPSWTDRILFYTKPDYTVRQEEYSCLPLTTSDHRLTLW